MINDFLQQTYFQNRVIDYIISIAIFILLVISIKIIKSILLKKLLQTWAKKTTTKIDDKFVKAFEERIKTFLNLVYFGAFYISIKQLTIDSHIERFFNIFIIIILDNLGIKISALVAGLGIGGIAIALAAQSVLGDLFSYFIIFFDRPFEIGDFIIIGDFLGTVEDIGIKTTRLRSLGGEELIFSNQDLTNSRVRNYKRMNRRRIVFKFGVIYQTTLTQLKKIPQIVKEIITQIPETTFDRAHFASYADFSLNFEVVYYINNSDYNKYMDIQQEINFQLKEAFEKEGIDFAYPTQTVFLANENKK